MQEFGYIAKYNAFGTLDEGRDGTPASLHREIYGQVLRIDPDYNHQIVARLHWRQLRLDISTQVVASRAETLSEDALEDLLRVSQPTFRHNAALASDDYDVADRALLLKRLEILPCYRGIGLTERIICDGAGQFGCGWILVKPMPTSGPMDDDEDLEGLTPEQWQEAMRVEQFPEDESKGIARLTLLAESIGFTAVKNSELMVRAIASHGMPVARDRNDYLRAASG